MSDIRTGGAFQPDALYAMRGGGFIGATMIGMNAVRRIIGLFLPSPFKLQSDMSGALCLFDNPTGTTFILPTPEVGLNYECAVVTPLTSGQNVVQTDAPTTCIVGTVAMGAKHVRSDGTTCTKLVMNTGVTAGAVTLTCISPRQWLITGSLDATGTTTPFATEVPAKPEAHAKSETHAKAEKV